MISKKFPADWQATGPIIAAVGIAAGLVAAIAWAPLPGALLVGSGSLLLGLTSPSIALGSILVFFPLQPLAVRIAERDLGLTGSALVVSSAWKELMLAGALVALVARLRLPPGRRYNPPIHIPDVLAVTLVVLVALAMLFDTSLEALNQARLLLFPIGVYLAVRLGGLTAPSVLLLIVGTATFVGAVGIVQAATIDFDWVAHYFGTPAMPIPWTFLATSLAGPRSSGTASSPNEFAMFVAIGAVVAVALLAGSRRRSRPALIVGLCVLLVAVVVSASRSAILGTVAALAVTFLLANRFRPDRGPSMRSFAAGLGPALVISAVVFVARGGISLLGGGAANEAEPARPAATFVPGSSAAGASPLPGGSVTESSTVAHVASLGEGIRHMLEHPLGIGLGKVGPRSLPGEGAEGIIIESWFLSIGVALGVAGLVWSVAWVLGMFFYGLRAAWDRRALAGAALAGTAVLAVLIGFVLPTMLEPQIAMLPWAIAGSIAGSARLSGERLEQTEDTAPRPSTEAVATPDRLQAPSE